MEYRNDLDAARMRIQSLEAKIAEREASLRAREAELAERDAEVGRLRQTPGKPAGGSSPGRILLLVATHLAVAGVVGSACFLLAWREPPPPPPPVVVAPSPSPPSQPRFVVDENGAVAEGRSVPPGVEGAASDGDTEDSETQIAHDRMQPKVRACHREEKATKPEASGFVTVIYDIEPTGKVGRVELGNGPGMTPWWSKDFEACVVAAYRKLTFRPSDRPKTTAKSSHFLMKNDLGF